MALGNCKYCNRPYRFNPVEEEPGFCEKCLADYNTAFVKIHQFILENEKPKGYQLSDIALIVNAAKVHRIFVQHFFQESELKKSMFQTDPGCCEHCNTELAPCERRYCFICNEKMMIIAQNLDDDNVTVLKSERQSRKAKAEGKKYGFRRD